MYPLSVRWTKSRGPVIMAVIWASAVALSSLQLVHGKAEKFTYAGQEFYDCTEVWEELDGKNGKGDGFCYHVELKPVSYST
ncbi:hypothetical protein JTE90_025310 [Oedothorax gibbosus]|uniref:Uncharacterized protein n=1 Tax=Oedothorax gibbosus TaxID=931172 RepID=A0AAV6V5S3_9ARAC|nr:hypothetical protein JTE90_025310 [Oedothorax gibbosus]